MSTEPATTRMLFAEMLSLSFEGRCLLEEHRHCQDPTRKHALRLRHVAVQQRWDELFARHAAACMNEARAVWGQGRQISNVASRPR